MPSSSGLWDSAFHVESRDANGNQRRKVYLNFAEWEKMLYTHHSSLDTRKFHLETVFLTLGLGWGESTVSPRQKETKHSPYMLNACACKDTCATAVMINALSLLFWMLKILPERGPSPAGTISTSFLDAAFFFSFCFPTFFHQTSITEAPLLSHYTQTLSLSFSFLLVFCSYFKMRHLSLLHF